MPNTRKNKDAQPTIRIKDIAEKAGVSIGTVDRVLHDRGEVSEKTKQKVLAIVKELNYQPNLLASSLASRKEVPFAVLIPKAIDESSYWTKPLSGIQKAERELAQYGVRIYLFFFDMTDKNSFKKATDEALKVKPRGVLFPPYFNKESIQITKTFEELSIPYVLIDSNIKTVGKLSYLGHDSYQSGYLSAKLIDLCTPANRSVAILNFGREIENVGHLKRRREGFFDYFSTKNPNRKLDIVRSETEEIESIAQNLNSLISRSENPLEGICVPNSRVYKVADYLKRFNHNHIHLIGYDLIPQNVEALKQEFVDFLICQRPEEQGYKGVYTLFDHAIRRKDPVIENFTSIDIITKENIEHYSFF